MEIFINGENINYKRESENTVYDIVSGLISWAEKEKNILAELRIDNVMYTDPESAVLKDTPWDQPEKISAEFIPVAEYILTVINEIDSYSSRTVELLKRLILEGNNRNLSSTLAGIESGLDWIKKASLGAVQAADKKNNTAEIRAIFTKVEAAYYRACTISEIEPVKILVAELEALQQILNTTARRAFIRVVQNSLRSLTKERAGKYTTQEGKQLTALAEKLLPFAAEQLQTGNDSRAMELIKDISDCLSTLLFLLTTLCDVLEVKMQDVTSGNKNLAGTLDELKDKLNDLVHAFETKDLVLVSDILEYEIHGIITDISSMLSAIQVSYACSN